MKIKIDANFNDKDNILEFLLFTIVGWPRIWVCNSINVLGAAEAYNKLGP